MLENLKDVRAQGKLAGIVPNQGSLMLRMPAVITKEIFNIINNLHPNDIARLLGPYVTEAEIAATIVRLNLLKEHINDESKCMVVQKMEDIFLKKLETKPQKISVEEESRYQQQETDILTSDAARRINSNNSYWARELYLFDSSEKNWNYLRIGLKDVDLPV